MTILNEVLLFIFEGFKLRHDKIIITSTANFLLIPGICFFISRFLKPYDLGSIESEASRSSSVNNSAPSSNFGKNEIPAKSFFPKNFIVFFALVILGVFVLYYFKSSSDISNRKFDLYFVSDYKNCNSPYEAKPFATISFRLNEQKNVFIIGEIYEDLETGKPRKDIQELEDCIFIDSMNWTCGGKTSFGLRSSKYSFVDGKFSLIDGGFVDSLSTKCATKVVER
jgi:hypothetical protein